MNGTRTFLIILETRNYISISSVIDDVGAEYTIDRRSPSFKLSISFPLLLHFFFFYQYFIENK